MGADVSDRPVDRWNPKLVTVTTEHPRKFVVPSGEPAGSSSVVPRGKTWGIRERGDLEGTVVHAYRCPVHGVLDSRVPRSDVPDAMPCPVRVDRWPEERTYSEAITGPLTDLGGFCGLTSPWAGSFCGQGIAAGEVTC